MFRGLSNSTAAASRGSQATATDWTKLKIESEKATKTATCPECKKQMKAPAELEGKKIRCKGCGTPVPVKAAAPAKPAKATAPAKAAEG